MTYRCVNRWSEFRGLGSGEWAALRGSTVFESVRWKVGYKVSCIQVIYVFECELEADVTTCSLAIYTQYPIMTKWKQVYRKMKYLIYMSIHVAIRLEIELRCILFMSRPDRRDLFILYVWLVRVWLRWETLCSLFLCFGRVWFSIRDSCLSLSLIGNHT
jgi:hypothetical protein